MKTKLTTSLALAGLLAFGAIGGTAIAASRAENPEATALQNAKVSLIQVITTAEQQTGGRAFDAGIDGKGSKTRFMVETTGPKGVQTVEIDAQTGLIVGGHAGGIPD
jgi:uncharacterized membrane protein YkoI